MTAVALTGVPLLAAVALAAAAAIAAIIALWSRFGRWRLLGRAAGVLLCELLVVLSAGLIANRGGQFYPSWQALLGHTGTATVTAPRPAGRLDAQLAGVTALRWQPVDSAGWRLAAPAEVVAPPGYAEQASATFPVVVELGGNAAEHSPGVVGRGVVGVVVVPSARTTAAALASLPAALARDLRVTGRGWALVTSAAQAPLAEQLIRQEPGRFAALAVVGDALPADVRPGPALAVAVMHSTSAATEWAVRQTAAALAAPLVLPTAVR